MASLTFLDEHPVGGIPCFASMIAKYLPKSKKKREAVYRIQMVIFTYFIYSLFNMARRPIAVVKLKFIDDCNTTESSINKTWCDERFYHWNIVEYFGLMDFFYTISYGFCLYASGIVGDCYNPRYYLTAGCFLSGYFCSLLGLTDYWNLRSFRFLGTMLILFGAAQSTAWPVVLSSVTHWYGKIGKRRGLFFGFWNTHNYLGSILGILLAGIWVDSKWMWSFFVPGFILAFSGVLVFSCMVVDPKDLRKLDTDVVNSRTLLPVATQRPKRREIPVWLTTNSSITMYEALVLPGVIEFATCMFFSRMVGYTFLFWLPVFIRRTVGGTAMRAAYYSLAYVVGGSFGGILAGIAVDLSRQSALVCSAFLVTSVPALLLGYITDLGANIVMDFFIFLIIGLFVEAPYVVISTTVSADLGTHKMVKRNDRALSTVGGIIEGTGAIGASIGIYISGAMLVKKQFWTQQLYIMVIFQLLAMLCIGRLAYKDLFRKQKKDEQISELSDYLKLPAFS